MAKADGEPHIDSDVDKDKAEEDLADECLAADKKEKNEEKALAASDAKEKAESVVC